MQIRCPSLDGVIDKVQQLHALLPAIGAAACGGGPGVGKPARTELAYLQFAMKTSLQTVLAAAVAALPEGAEAAAGMVQFYTGFPLEHGSQHRCPAPASAVGQPGVLLRAAVAMEGYRHAAWRGGEQGRVEYFPKGQQSERKAEGGEVALFGEELASDLVRARRWVRAWVETPEELGGKRWETGAGGRDEGKDAAQVAERIERLLGIQQGQGGEYNADMQAAAERLLPHIQEFVNEYDPERQERGQAALGATWPRMERQPGDATVPAAGLTPAQQAQWSALVLSAWRRQVRADVPALFARRFRACAREQVGWGKVRGARGAQMGMGV